MSKTVKLDDAIKAITESVGIGRTAAINALNALPTEESKEGWIDAITPPKDEDWYIVKVDGKHHILPHNYTNGNWWCYGSSVPNESNVTHYRPFED